MNRDKSIKFMLPAPESEIKQYQFNPGDGIPLAQARILVGASPKLEPHFDTLALTITESEKLGPDQWESLIKKLPENTDEGGVGVLSGYGLTAYHIAFFLGITRTPLSGSQKLMVFEKVLENALKLADKIEKQWISSRNDYIQKLWVGSKHNTLSHQGKKAKILSTALLFKDEECKIIHKKIKNFCDQTLLSDNENKGNHGSFRKALEEFVEPIRDKNYKNFLKNFSEQDKEIYCMVSDEKGEPYSPNAFLNHCLMSYAIHEMSMLLTVAQRYQVKYLFYPGNKRDAAQSPTAHIVKLTMEFFSSFFPEEAPKPKMIFWPVKFKSRKTAIIGKSLDPIPEQIEPIPKQILSSLPQEEEPVQRPVDLVLLAELKLLGGLIQQAAQEGEKRTALFLANYCGSKYGKQSEIPISEIKTAGFLPMPRRREKKAPPKQLEKMGISPGSSPENSPYLGPAASSSGSQQFLPRPSVKTRIASVLSVDSETPSK